MEIKEWTYEEYPSFDEEIEGVKRIYTSGNEMGTYIYSNVEYKEIDGIECYYYDFTKEQIDYIKSFAKKRNLLVSGGSDFHGNPERKNEIGVCINNNGYIPKELLDMSKPPSEIDLSSLTENK